MSGCDDEVVMNRKQVEDLIVRCCKQCCCPTEWNGRVFGRREGGFF